MNFIKFFDGKTSKSLSNTLLVFAILLNMNIFLSKKPDGNNFKIVYISPKPGSIYNLPETNIIISANNFIDVNSFQKDTHLIVKGSKSGVHNGKINISDDQKTIIFTPQKEFSEDEIVNVKLLGIIKSQNGKSIDSISFKFSVNKKNDLKKINSQYLSELLSEENWYPKNQNKYINKTKITAVQDSLPADFPKFDITVSHSPDPDNIFISTTSGRTPYLMILDNNGKPIYYKRTPSGTYDFTVQPNGLLTYYDMKSSCYYAMDSSYAIVDSFKCGNGYDTDIHELRLLPNGHALILGRDAINMNLSKIVSGGDTNAYVMGSVIQELDRNKNVVFQWLCWDHFDIRDTYSDIKQPSIDFTHANAIDIDDDGNLLVSFRNLQEITKIDRETGDIIWRLGGKNNQFTFINDSLGFSWQHSIRRLPNGDLILFDNGCMRQPSSQSFSRAVEYKMDMQKKTAELVWQFRNKPDVYSIGLGYAQRLRNGNTFIGWGAAFPTITEVRPDGTKAFEMSFQDNLYSYRAYRFPWKLNNSNPGNLLFSTTENFFKPVVFRDTNSFRLVIRNKGNRQIAINSIINNTRSFYMPLNIPAIVPIQDSLILKIFFKPVSFGFVSDTIIINYDGGTQRILVSGNSPYPQISSNANMIDFGETKIHQPNIKQIQITNLSINNLIIDSLALKSKQCTFTQVSYPFSIPSLDTLKLDVVFNPDSSSELSDTLFIFNNSNIPIFKILISGSGVTINPNNNLPVQFCLNQNYPNPFNQTTIIKYSITKQQNVKLNIFDIRGKLIKTLINQTQPVGTYSLRWDGGDYKGKEVCSGVYIYKITSGNFVKAKKMILLK